MSTYFRTSLDAIFEIVLRNPEFFPAANKATTDHEQYLEKWIKRYADAVSSPPSSRRANPKKHAPIPPFDFSFKRRKP